MKREIPILLTVLCGLAITWSFFTQAPVARAVNSELLAWAVIFFSVAFLLGIGNLVRISLKQIASGHPDRAYKVVLLVVLLGYMAVGIAEIHGWLSPMATGTDPAGQAIMSDTVYRDYIYYRIFQPLQSTMFSLLAFYIASAAFRAFRARSFEAVLLLMAGAIVMLGQVPLGDALTFDLASRWQDFLMKYINAAGQKAIIMGAAFGTLATGLRIVLGLERSYLSE
ncbi:MAG: hypothetical protein ACI9EF_003494 [Pseudohongiellaceae bacterium]|jgi:hypothetical protein